MTAIWHPSPNFGPRRRGETPDTLLLHFTAMESYVEARDRLCDPEAEVSAHYLISRTGEVLHMVEEPLRAWHAGAGQWGASTDINSRSIGIELDNTGAHPFSAPLMDALDSLVAGIRSRWPIPPKRVLAHSDIAPTRKTDPGPRFDWRRLALQGHAVWSEAEGAAIDPAQFERDLTTIGYPDGIGACLRLSAFRLRFRPWGEGPLTGTDCARAADIAARYPVDRSDPTA